MTEVQPGMAGAAGNDEAVSSGRTNVKARHSCESRNRHSRESKNRHSCESRNRHSCESRNPEDGVD